ncbi:hypothetical protein TWF694_005448 [Orbilia ellipsospora]|uniref:Uncharacterized protein n=1 Tax=Orbilia ellipsospora TaxID=2528407 RepID=A0AAV9WTE3_9PEZI
MASFKYLLIVAFQALAIAASPLPHKASNTLPRDIGAVVNAGVGTVVGDSTVVGVSGV